MRFVLTLGFAALTALGLGSPALADSVAQVQATAGIVAPSSGATGALQPAVPAPSRGARSLPRRSAAAPAGVPPRAPSSPLTAAPSSVLANFNGVSSLDSAVTNFGQQFEPPDQGLCVGNGFVVEMVNSAYTVYRPNGSVVTGPFNVNGPFDIGLREFTSDPRCYYDAATGRWFATILFISSDNTTSSFDVAVSDTSDPTKLWTNYSIDTTHPGGPGCPCFGDQPTLGIDDQNLYVTTNEFSILGPQFNGAQIYALAKRDLVTPGSKLHFVHFGDLSIGGAPAVSVQPALSTGTPSAEYFLNSLDPNGTFDTRVGVWAMTNRGAVASGGKPKLTNFVLTSEVYGLPPNAEQKGSPILIAADDDRMQQVQFVNGSVWGELDTAITIPGDSAERAGAAWFQVQPVLANGALTGAQMKRQGYVALPGNYLLYPALQVTPAGAAAMVVSVSGKTRFPSAGYATMAPGATSFGPVKIAAAGSTSYQPKPGQATRWGDYSWSVLDPAGSSIWMATEYVPPKSSQTPDGVRNWGTRVFEVRPGG